MNGFSKTLPSTDVMSPGSQPRSQVVKASYDQSVLLADWWLIEVESNSQGRRLGVAGFRSNRRQAIRHFKSTAIVKRHDAVTLETEDGITIVITNGINMFKSLENGFPHERRRSLEEWMTMLLSDIDLSRRIPVASFLELETAARSSFLDENLKAAESNTLERGSASPLQVPALSSLSVFAGSTSMASDNGGDTAYETSDIGTPSIGVDDSIETGECCFAFCSQSRQFAQE